MAVRLTQGDDGDLVVDRKYGDVEVINRKRPVQRDGRGRGVSMATAVCPSSLAVRHDECDRVRDRVRPDLSS